jgi:hypothetical protein
VNLTDLFNLLQQSDAASHDPYFPRALMNFLNSNWDCASSVYNALVVMNWDKGNAVIKDAPISFDQVGQLCSLLG